MANSDVDVKLGFDGTKAEKDASSTLESIGSKAGSLAGKLKTSAAVGVAAITAAGAAMVKSAVDAYAQYEQLTGGVETLFKDSAGTVEAYAEQAYKTAGMSANQYMDSITSFSASLIQGLGGDTAKAAEYANTAVTDMADNANKMGTSIETITQTYQSLARGNYAMLDNLKLGYGGTKAELERLVDDANKYKESMGEVGDLTSDNFADVVEAIHVVQTEMGITGTTAEEAATTIEGSVNSMKAAWENWLAGLGNEDADMGALTDQLVQSVVTAGQNIIPRFGMIMSNLVTTVTTYAPQVGEAIMSGLSQLDFTSIGQTASNLILMLVDGIVQNLPMLASAALQIVTALGQGLITNGPQILESLGQLLLQLANYIIQNVPNILNAAVQFFGMLIQGIAQNAPMIIATLISLLGQLIAQVISWAAQMLGQAISAGAQFLSGLAGQMSQVPGRVAEFLGNVISNVVSWVGEMASNAIDAASRFASNLIDGLASIPGQVVDIGGQIIQGMVDGVVGAAGSLIDAVGGAVNDAIGWAKGLLGIASPSKVFRRMFQYVMEGAELGIEDKRKAPVDAISGVYSDISSLSLPSPAIALAGATDNSRIYSVTIGDVTTGGDDRTAQAVERFFADLGIIQRTGAY